MNTRRLLVTLSCLALLSVPLSAQEQEPSPLDRTENPSKKDLSLDVKPTGGIGLGFQLSNRLSIHPYFGGVRPSDSGNQIVVGTDIRYALSEGGSTTPYILGNLTYGRNVLSETQTGATERLPRIGTAGLGLGLRQSISDRFSLFGEFSLQRSTANIADPAWNDFQFGDRNAVRFGFGVTFNFR